MIPLMMVVLATIKWTPDSLNRELLPIAYLESSNGRNINHESNSRGEFFSSFGQLGLKPIVAWEEYSRSRLLQNKYTGLQDPVVFITSFKTNPTLYNLTCNAHWDRIRLKTTSIEQAVYAWRFGLTAAKQATPEQIVSNKYVQAYIELKERTSIIPIKDK